MSEQTDREEAMKDSDEFNKMAADLCEKHGYNPDIVPAIVTVICAVYNLAVEDCATVADTFTVKIECEGVVIKAKRCHDVAEAIRRLRKDDK